MKKTSITLLMLCTLLVYVHSHYLPVSRIKKTSLSAAQISANAAASNTDTTLVLSNYQNVVYYIYLNVGTPAQTMGVQFDTGSNIMWLPTQKAGVNPYYNTSKSSTFTNTSTPGGITYADGSEVAGTYGTDKLVISGTPIDITATFLWVTQDTGMNFPPQIAGLVGMGYTNIPNFLDVAYQNNQISSPVFTLQIQTDTQQSIVYYNQIPQSIKNSTVNINVVGDTYWQVNVLGVYVGGVDMTSSSANVAVIDSGTSYFYLNLELFNNIINRFFQDCDNSLPTPECPCSSTSKWPQFSFLFEGIQVYIEPSQYTYQLSSTVCTYNFGTLSTVGSILLLGDIFFQGYVITFNKLTSQVGFKGKLGSVQNVVPNSKIYGYIMMGVMGLIIIVGLIAFCLLDKYVPQQSLSIDTATGKQLVVYAPKPYRLKQPML